MGQCGLLSSSLLVLVWYERLFARAFNCHMRARASSGKCYGLAWTCLYLHSIVCGPCKSAASRHGRPPFPSDPN